MIHACTNSERGKTGCPFRWLLGYGIGLVPERPRMPLFVGSHWHKVMDLFWPQGLSWEERYDLSARYISETFDAFEEELEELDRFDPQARRLPYHSDVVGSRKLLDEMLKTYWSSPSAKDGDDWNPVETEVVIWMPCKTPSGRRSHVTWYAGAIDKRLELGPRKAMWIGEHKTTTHHLEEYRYKVEYKPQAATYAILSRWHYGVYPAGVVYDVVRKAWPTPPEEYKVKQNGGLYKKLPSEATWQGLLLAIMMCRERGEKDEDWYESKVAELRDNPPLYHKRIHIRFELEELRRTQREMYTVATMVRRWHAKIGNRWGWVRSEYQKSEYSGRRAVVQTLLDQELYFPRNPNECAGYFRCPYRAVCRYRSVDSLEGFRLKRTQHEELERDESE